MITEYLMSDNVKNVLLEVYEGSQESIKERLEIMSYYSFYKGPCENEEDKQYPHKRGQSWELSKDLDFTPTQEIRNHTKKLLQKQQRFMFGQSPDILVKPYDNETTDNAEGLRQLIDDVLEDGEFWNETFKAFLDSTIGKRVLLLVEANPGMPIQYKYYTANQFNYKLNPHNYKELDEVIIAYQEPDTIGKPADEQIWHKWKYFMNGEACILEKSQYNGNAKKLNEQVINTMLNEIPARVIVNGGLLGDIKGTSDIVDLMPIANSYNKRMSDLSDALRFKMFEQMVAIDASADSIDSIKIAPNALIDLKGDPSKPDSKPDLKMVSSQFTFVEAAQYYLDKALADMYEILDQPRPEDIKNVPSAKALKFIFYDLMARCEEKWKSWEPSILWAIRFTLDCIDKFNLYPDNEKRVYINTNARISLNHNYPIPEDEFEQKKTAMLEVDHKVRSRKSYMRDYGTIEDENELFNEILEEERELQNATSDPFNTMMENVNTTQEVSNTNPKEHENNKEE